jgi:hypothetical protein
MKLRRFDVEQFQVESLGGMTSGVLIVEDEFLVRTHAAEFMEDRGFNVYEAASLRTLTSRNIPNMTRPTIARMSSCDLSSAIASSALLGVH